MTIGSPDTLAVELVDVDKAFYGVKANDRVNFQLARGEIHALLGENGAGKSTLCSILAGLYRPDAGEMFLEGRAVTFKSPKDALAAGIGMVYQHFRLVPNLTVAENFALGYPDVGFRLEEIELYRAAQEIGERHGEGDTLFNWGSEVRKLGETPEAVRRAEAALEIFTEIESPDAETARAALKEWRG